MAKIQYKKIAFQGSTFARVKECDVILSEYIAQGIPFMTLRQLYYQLVARGVIRNSQNEYKALSRVVSDARLGGYLDWDHIEDRVRSLRQRPSWETPHDALKAVADQYHIDWWKESRTSPEVWVEKDAIMGIVAHVANELDVPYYACRGFNSQTALHDAAIRFRYMAEVEKKTPVVFYLGDHDPSGLEMTRDLQRRMYIFGADVKIHRLALNYEQIEEYGLQDLPNPVKVTDSRYKNYVAEFGEECWEMDAVSPKELWKLIREGIMSVVDLDVLEAAQEREKVEKDHLGRIVGFVGSMGVTNRLTLH